MFRVDELIKATKGRLINHGRFAGIRGISIDSRAIKPQYAFIAIRGKNFDGHDFICEAIKKGACCIIKEAGNKKIMQKAKMLKAAFIEVKDTLKALGDIARFQRIKFNIPVIAVTGSNGKTTTKEMIAQVLSKQFKVLKNEGTKNNQIGLPLTLVNLNSSYDIAVLEVGTNHFGEVKYLTKICLPNIGIITNIGPAHLEYLRNLEGVFGEKYKMIQNLEKPHIGILNADDSLLNKKALMRAQKSISLGFGIENQCDFFASNIKMLNGKIEFLVNQKYKFTPLDRRSKIKDASRHLTGFTLKTLGHYNIYNALAAIAVARLFGMEYKDIALRLADFIFPQSRLEFKKVNDIKFIDDTYNSNPFSLRQALNTLANFKIAGRKIFVMGDMLELGNSEKMFHYQAGKKIAKYCDLFITVGKLSRLAATAAKNSGFDSKDIFSCETITQARDILFNRISLNKGDLVLIKGSRLMRMEEIFNGVGKYKTLS